MPDARILCDTTGDHDDRAEIDADAHRIQQATCRHMHDEAYMKETMTRRTIMTATTAALAAVALAIAAPLSASAHVRVDPDQASPGGYTVLTFRVPTESATAGTVKLEVDLPTATPFTSVSYQPVAGWSAKVTTSTLPKPV
jgi:hypothetical protein